MKNKQERNQRILEAYVPHISTIREVSRTVGVSPKTVRKVLKNEGIPIVSGKRKPFTAQHRKRLTEAQKGRKVKRSTLLKIFSKNLKHEISVEWLEQFEDFDKLKFINKCVRKSAIFNIDKKWYISYIEKFYYDKQFNKYYKKWLANPEDSLMRPSLDHITPRSKGGSNDLDNLQFIPWLENRAKGNMDQKEWEKIKANIKDYLV